MNPRLSDNLLGDPARPRVPQRPVSTRLLERIKYMAHLAERDDAHDVWMCLRRSDYFGRCVMHIGNYDVRLIPQGEGIFWHESTKENGCLFLLRPAAVADRLENFLDDGVQNVPE